MTKISPQLKKIWTVAMVLYIICSSAFSYGDLRMLNTYALYFFLGVSAFCILVKAKVKLNATVLCLVLYAVIMLIGAMYTPATEKSVTRVLYAYGTMMVLAVCFVQYIETIEDVKGIFTAYMWAGLALAIYVYAQHGSQLWLYLRQNVGADETDINRLGNDMVDANTIGLYTAVSVLIASFKVIFEKERIWKKILYVAIIVFCFVIDMASASKKGLLLLAIGAVGIWLYNALGSKNVLKQLRNLVFLGALGIVLFFVITRIPIFSGIAVRIESFFGTVSGDSGNASDELRMNMIRNGLTVWLQHPLFGAGTASSSYYFGVYAHNNYVEMLMNSGTIGFVIFYIPQIIAVCELFAYQKICKASSKHAILAFALLFSVLTCGFGLVYYYERYFMILVVVVAAVPKLAKEQPIIDK